MKLKSYIAELQVFADKYPDLEVVYFSHDEMNPFCEVREEPTIGNYLMGSFDEDCEKVNAVCLN